YWSHDSAGVQHLGPEEATALAFPSIQLIINVVEKSWDASVYASLRQFHTAKGFDPNSQDIARHLGHPLFEL
ncbi:hypothetical protein B0H13DRAFT_1519028, partial [Mycena leptocephala]